jgi:hypothetical protein
VHSVHLAALSAERSGIVWKLILLLLVAGTFVLPGGASGATFQERFSGTAEPVACNGEVVFIEGIYHLRVGTTEDASGGLHTTFSLDFHGTGTSPSGARYILNSTGPGSNNVNSAQPDPETDEKVGAAAEEGTGVQRFSVLRIGPGGDETEDDLYFIALFHYTVTPDGSLVSLVERFEPRCD